MDKKKTLDALKKWAKSNKANIIGIDNNGQINEPDESHVAYHVEKGDWGVEVRPENGWAYIHGFGSLEGYGTNISDISELGDAIKRLQKAK